MEPEEQGEKGMVGTAGALAQREAGHVKVLAMYYCPAVIQKEWAQEFLYLSQNQFEFHAM